MAFYDQNHLEQLHADAKLNSIDLSRAKIERSANDAFLVLLDAPKVDVVTVLGHAAPRSILCSYAAQAEGELLTQCLRIQRAERLKVRQGRVYGWTTEQICRRPLTDEELTAYRAEVKHRVETAKLVEQLNEALEQQKRDAAKQAGIDRLAEHYGLQPVVATVPNDSIVKADPAAEPMYARRQTRARKGAKR